MSKEKYEDSSKQADSRSKCDEAVCTEDQGRSSPTFFKTSSLMDKIKALPVQSLSAQNHIPAPAAFVQSEEDRRTSWGMRE